jgi:hypothetical protein
MRFTHIVVAMIALAITTSVVAEPTWQSHYIVGDDVTGSCKTVEMHRGIVHHDAMPTHDDVSVGLIYRSRALADAALEEAARYEIPDCSIHR